LKSFLQVPCSPIVQVSSNPILQKIAVSSYCFLQWRLYYSIYSVPVNSQFRTESVLSQQIMHASFVAEFFNQLITSFPGGMLTLLYIQGTERLIH
jgi:hypothetical protein